MKIAAVIPARYASTRLAGKVLAKDTGKFLIQHTYEQACQAGLVEHVLIATDDQRVRAACDSFGAACVMTSPEHQSGTDRIAEAARTMDVEIVVNLQADEPEIEPDSIDLLARLLMDHSECPMATLAAPFDRSEQIADPNIVKVVVDADWRAIYFSRSPIPFDREAGGVGDTSKYLRHLGIYAYRRDFLLEITSLAPSPLEKMEKLEQLRVIENGHSILVGKVERTCDGIDTPQQYARFVERWRRREAKT